jgi:DNA-binding transcriptional LysR family regulator
VERWPDVQLAVRSGHSEEIADLVAGGEIDIGLVRRRDYRGLDVRLLSDDELRLVVRPGHPFVALGEVSVARLATERLILFDRSSSYFDLTNAMFRTAGVEPRGTLEMDTIDAAMQMVKAGLGVALLPGVSTAGEISRGALCAVRLADVAPIRRQVMAIRRPEARPPTAPLRNFLEILDRIGEVLPSASGSSPPDRGPTGAPG